MMLVFGVAVAIVMPIAIEAAGKDPDAWSLIVVCIAIPATLIGLIRFWSFRESADAAEVAAERVGMRDIFYVLRRNPYIWAVSAIGFFASVASSIAAGTYYFRYIVGDLALQGVAAVGCVVLFPVMAILPKLARRYSISFLLAGSSGLSILGMLMFIFAGANIPTIMVASVLIGFAALPFNFLAPILIIDNANYNQWKGHRKLESVGGALFNFATTLGVVVAAGILGLMLMLTGYEGTSATQTDTALHGIVALNSYIPACFALIAGVLSVLYHRLEKRVDEICAELELPRTTL